jgi:hypothetical protein
MGNYITKFCAGETDINQNGIPDNKELIELLEKHIDSLTTMGKKKIIKIINKNLST